MSLPIVIIATISQIILFILVILPVSALTAAAMGGARQNARKKNRRFRVFKIKVEDSMLYLLIASPIISIVVLWFQFFNHGDAQSYYWLLLPIVVWGMEMIILSVDY